MIILIAGTTHTGKTNLAQKLLQKYSYPYLSIDHLKMGLIRSEQTSLTPEDDDKLTDYLWPIVREMIKTAIENDQNMVIEGCYIPFSWKEDFTMEYLEHIRYYCLIMTKKYIETHFEDIQHYGNVIENRLDDSSLCEDLLVKENLCNLDMCKKYGCNYILIDGEYQVDVEL